MKIKMYLLLAGIIFGAGQAHAGSKGQQSGVSVTLTGGYGAGFGQYGTRQYRPSLLDQYNSFKGNFSLSAGYRYAFRRNLSVSFNAAADLYTGGGRIPVLSLEPVLTAGSGSVRPFIHLTGGMPFYDGLISWGSVLRYTNAPSGGISYYRAGEERLKAGTPALGGGAGARFMISRMHVLAGVKYMQMATIMYLKQENTYQSGARVESKSEERDGSGFSRLVFYIGVGI